MEPYFPSLTQVHTPVPGPRDPARRLGCFLLCGWMLFLIALIAAGVILGQRDEQLRNQANEHLAVTKSPG